MGQRSDEAILTLDGKPLVIGGRYILDLVRVANGKAFVRVTDTLKPTPLVSPDIDIEKQDGSI